MNKVPPTLLNNLTAELNAAAREAQTQIKPPQKALSVEEQCESAAKRFEEMLAEVKTRYTALANAQELCMVDLKRVEETTLAIREKGKHAAMLIQEVHEFSNALRAACEDIVKKLGE